MQACALRAPFVIAGLDPAIHLLAVKMMDARVELAHDQ